MVIWLIRVICAIVVVRRMLCVYWAYAYTQWLLWFLSPVSLSQLWITRVISVVWVFYYFIRGFVVIRVFVVIMLLGQFEMLVVVSLKLGSIVWESLPVALLSFALFYFQCDRVISWLFGVFGGLDLLGLWGFSVYFLGFLGLLGLWGLLGLLGFLALFGSSNLLDLFLSFKL